ncbi:MAG TPA: molybdopterin-dependent oxidoreductase [Blastocatellia bacterium]|jgi:DMSO/TMAO reductase YedYZ molybdopterin-dependent catalytic subunit
MIHLRRICFAIGIFVALIPAVSGQTPQTPAPDVSLSVGGEVENPIKLTAADLAKLPRRSVRAKDHDGKESEFEGSPLIEVLKLAGVKFGEGLRGKNLALYLVVEASDGYRAVYALPELDPAYTDKVVMLVDKRDGKALDAKEGPLRIVVPDEKMHARWVRQVTGLVVKRAQ